MKHRFKNPIPPIHKIICFILAGGIIAFLLFIMIHALGFHKKEELSHKEKLERIRNFKIESTVLYQVKQFYEKNYSGKEYLPEEYFAALFLKNQFEVRLKNVSSVDITEYANDYAKDFEFLQAICKPILYDMEVFPVPVNGDFLPITDTYPRHDGTNYQKGYVYFSDSWNYKRTYGGDRRHEGCDIMAEINERGRYPVVSMTDGVVEHMGWLELGGYRIGIRSENGGYFYYAHLCDYASNLKEGDTVYAGQYLGTMGDTGYSKVEGTTGNFDVHLHISIYVTYNNVEYSINPYYILKNLRVIRANY